MLSILLLGEVEGEIRNRDLEILDYHRNRQPANALFHYAFHKYSDGVQDVAVALLLDESYSPAERLPTNQDRDESWIWQRDYGDDWKPAVASKGTQEHHGGDFLFLAGLILKDFGGR